MKQELRHDDGRTKLMKKIQELEFAVIDLNLYLDNFPDNQQALTLYNDFSCKLMQNKTKYETEYGALTNFGYAQSQYPWTWVKEPWPWETGE